MNFPCMSWKDDPKYSSKHFLFLLGMQGAISQPSLKVGRPPLLSSGHQNVGKKDLQHLWAQTLKDLHNHPTPFTVWIAGECGAS